MSNPHASDKGTWSPGPTTVGPGSTGWVAALARHAHLHPERPALICGEAERSWAELDERVAGVAGALRSLGVAPGDRVVLLMGNGVEFAEALMGATAAGAIPVPVNFRLVAGEVAALVADCGAAALVVDAERAALAGELRGAAGGVDAAATPGCLVVGLQDASATKVAGQGARGYEAALAAAGTSGGREPARPGDPAVILYTSGTTGRPKGAVLTHHNLTLSAMTTMWASRLGGEDDVVLCAVPLFHVAGVCSLAANVLMGATTVVMASSAFDPGRTVEAMERYGVTSVFLVPTQWAGVCSLPDLAERKLALRSISWGAAPATPELLAAMGRAFPGVPNIAVFGQTEMSPVTCALRGEDAIAKSGSVGRPVPWVDVRVVDERMQDVVPGEVGEIIYRGPTVMAGYWGQPEATAAAMEGGWFHSGDLVRRDEDGFVYVVDRKKDVIISGGENIYSTEVEAVIDAHPAVLEVAVVGVPHPKWGETPVAVVVPTSSSAPPGAEEITRWCRASLASFKKPSEVLVVDVLPRNPSGKVLKTELRARYRDLFAGEAG